MIRTLIAAAVLALFANAASTAPQDVWIDADPACGLGKTADVDDCWAIVAAIRSSRLNVVGLSTVFGNAGPGQTATLARKLLDTIRRLEPARAIPPLFEGATEPVRAQRRTPLAVRKLEAALSARAMIILALGPVTNIAMLLKRRPDLARRITAIVAVAGQAPGQVFSIGKTPLLHFHDLNVRKDADAFDIVLRSGVPVHLIPFDVGIQAMVSRSDLASLIANGGLDQWIGARSLPWLAFWEGTFGATGFAPFDTMAVGYVIAPRNFSCTAMSATLVRRRGLFVVRDTLEVEPPGAGGVMVTYCRNVSPAVRNAVAGFVSSPDRIVGSGPGQHPSSDTTSAIAKRITRAGQSKP